MTDTRRAFHATLDDIMRDIVRIAAHVSEALPRATEALLANDSETSQQIIDADDVLDDLTVEIEERCYSSLALQQPMATDLRAIICAIWLVSEIERSGDLVVNICKAQQRIRGVELPPAVRGHLQQMDERASELFRMCMDAYAEGNADLAAALDALDDELDQLHADYIQEVLTWGGGGDVQAAVQLALIGRYYERIGDHAVNVGERVRYMVEGWLPEHAPHADATNSEPEGHGTPA